MLLNFHLDNNLQIGKEIIDTFLSNETAIYFRNFTHVLFERPDINDRSATTRYNRRVLAYRAILSRAGFLAPSNVRPNITNLFNQELLQAMQTSTSNNASDYQSAAIIFANSNASWGQIATAFESLDKFMRDNTSGYQAFETNYVNRPRGSGERWADEDLKKILGLFQYPNGTRLIGRMAIQHTDSVDSDYADDIYQDLKNGKLILIRVLNSFSKEVNFLFEFH